MTASSAAIKLSLDKIERLDQAIQAQREFLFTIPDPDTRYRAEGNLIQMVIAVDALRELHQQMLNED